MIEVATLSAYEQTMEACKVAGITSLYDSSEGEFKFSKMFLIFRNNVRPDQIKSAHWAEKWYQNLKDYPRPDINKESTYQECTEWSMDIETQVLTYTMWEGDFAHGQPQNVRCWWKIDVSSPTKPVEELILGEAMSELNRVATALYLKQEEDKKNKAVGKILQSFFKE